MSPCRSVRFPIQKYVTKSDHLPCHQPCNAHARMNVSRPSKESTGDRHGNQHDQARNFGCDVDQ